MRGFVAVNIKISVLGGGLVSVSLFAVGFGNLSGFEENVRSFPFFMAVQWRFQIQRRLQCSIFT